MSLRLSGCRQEVWRTSGLRDEALPKPGDGCHTARRAESFQEPLPRGKAAGVSAQPDDLTLALLARVAVGDTTAQAAAACGVSASTLERRFRDLRDAWGVDTTVQLVVRAVRLGLL